MRLAELLSTEDRRVTEQLQSEGITSEKTGIRPLDFKVKHKKGEENKEEWYHASVLAVGGRI